MVFISEWASSTSPDVSGIRRFEESSRQVAAAENYWGSIATRLVATAGYAATFVVRPARALHRSTA